MKKTVYFMVALCLLNSLVGCGRKEDFGDAVITEGTQQSESGGEEHVQASQKEGEAYRKDTKISEVMDAPVFDGYGRLIFPVDSGGCKLHEKSC